MGDRVAHSKPYGLEALVGALPGVVWELDVRTDSVTYVSEGVGELLGHPAEALVGSLDRVLGFVHPDERADLRAAVRRAAGGEQVEVRFRALTASGGLRWLQTAMRPLGDGRVAGLAIDAMETLQAEHRLAVHEALTAALAGASSLEGAAGTLLERLCEGFAWEVGGLWLCDADARLRYVAGWHSPLVDARRLLADSAALRLGPGEGLIGRVLASGADLWVSDLDDFDDFRRAGAAAAAGLHGVCAFPVTSGVRPVGVLEFFSREVRPRDAAVARLLGTFGSQIGGLVERIEADRARQTSEAREHAYLEAALDAVVLAGDDGRVLEWNPAAARLFGYTRAEAVGREIAELIVPESLREAHREAFARFAETGRGTLLGRRMELPAERADGSELVVELTLSRVAGDRPIVLGAIRDLTEHRRLEEQLRRSQKMDAIGRLAGGVAHDFNNILSVVDGYAELIRRQSAEPETLHAAAQIGRAAGRAAGLTRQLLAVSRGQMIEPRVLDVDDVVRGLRSLLERVIGADVEMRFVLGAGTERVVADRGQLEQVLLNLVVNARDAMPDGGRLTVETGVTVVDERLAAERLELDAGRYVTLMIADTGVGMDAETRERIFEPFFTTKPEGKGTGLGLATAYGIVRQAGGSIWVYSEVGHGTVFRIYLPCGAGRAPEPAAEATPPSEGERAGIETVLVVEDDDAVRRLVELTLEGAGYTVLAARTAADALAVFDERAVDLLVTDVVMPGLSGRALADEVQRRSPSTAVLFTSGYVGDALAERGVGEGAAFIAKPFEISAFLGAVRRTLDGNSTA